MAVVNGTWTREGSELRTIETSSPLGASWNTSGSWLIGLITSTGTTLAFTEGTITSTSNDLTANKSISLFGQIQTNPNSFRTGITINFVEGTESTAGNIFETILNQILSFTEDTISLTLFDFNLNKDFPYPTTQISFGSPEFRILLTSETASKGLMKGGQSLTQD